MDKVGHVAATPGPLARPSHSARPRLNLTITSDLQKVCILKIQNLFIRPIKIVHLTYKSVYPTYKTCASDLKNVCILPSKVVHPTYKSSASDLQKLCIGPTKSVLPTNKSMCIRPTMATTY